MPEIRYSERFIEDASSIKLANKRMEVRRRVEQLADFPELGSPNLPDSILEQYRPGVRKLVVDPFLVVCEVNEDAGTVDVLGMIHPRAAW